MENKNIIELKRKFNKLEKERKSLYWLIHNLSDDYYQVRVDLRKKFSMLKSIFLKYKYNKDSLTPEILEQLENNLIKFKKYMEQQLEKRDKELEKLYN